MDLTTSYLGLRLNNPVVVSSCGLTETVEGVRRCADAGAGAVVLKSIFEEEIDMEAEDRVQATESATWHPEAAEYLERFGREESVEHYLKLIREAKEAVSIPVIASVHCASDGKWTEFATRVQKAGADALELNVFVLPADPRRDAKANDKVYFNVARKVIRKVSIPVALKIGPYFSGLSKTVVELSRTGIRGLVLFNRFFRIDFDIEERKVVPARLFSSPDEIVLPLRWISILSGRVGCDLAASTGIHDGAGIVKQLLAGAAATQVCSALYENEIEHLGTMLEQLRSWMGRHGYETIDAFRGKMRQGNADNPAAHERVQFMRAITGVG